MTDPGCPATGVCHAPPRHAAGTDPAKRARILAGAREVFMSKGFDASGVNDICHAAGVSKSTLYVYFENKEDLFERMVEIEREHLFQGLGDILSRPLPVADVLQAYGTAITGLLCSDKAVQAQRIIIGIAERMPEIGARFHAGSAMRAQAELAAFLRRRVDAGELRIPDAALAAAQFIALATATLWKPRLFGRDLTPPDGDAVESAVRGAVGMFLASYGAADAGKATLSRRPQPGPPREPGRA